MENIISLDLLFRWAHVLFGITWIGLLYYFNFIQGEYFKEAEASAKADATKKLAPRALWWFRWGAMFTFITGLVLLMGIRKTHGIDGFIAMGALMGTFMFLNVWLIIWPNQKIVCGIVEGDASVAGPKALLASRTNTLFSIPMLLGMLASFHGTGKGGTMIDHAAGVSQGMTTGIIAVLALVVLLELNAIFGKLGPMASVKGVIHSSIALAVVCLGLLQLV
ncbi:urate hydroxylase PuuD [Dasania sp. GY-MA-18]|uniref:Urate hydroxylase PuuD n=1 Tax=Dasania phycosphaerae TaxID=2950436 RepID=A0A9J6RPG4_9GAMM|nr:MULTISPECIES: urate hydroxylase PuuD [Dasania]MCR8923630.1 urate hydroxylase PuuD [Dasania sp. GY-MA-18]MCZ0866064.1 urate hydroxylase PuuD [Dasania phycosphaerae]MCZ0869788.1 urate hydroxylase PuuD [Dasania phycosphaerae]